MKKRTISYDAIVHDLIRIGCWCIANSKFRSLFVQHALTKAAGGRTMAEHCPVLCVEYCIHHASHNDPFEAHMVAGFYRVRSERCQNQQILIAKIGFDTA